MKKTYLKQICGVWFGCNVFGNCFNPAVVLDFNDSPNAGKKMIGKISGEKTHIWKASLIIRSSWRETKIYWRGGLVFDWNSEHLAVRFGKHYEADHGRVSIFKSRILGRHVDC